MIYIVARVKTHKIVYPLDKTMPIKNLGLDAIHSKSTYMPW
jgi:hypothetical protein